MATLEQKLSNHIEKQAAAMAAAAPAKPATARAKLAPENISQGKGSPLGGTFAQDWAPKFKARQSARANIGDVKNI